MFLNRLCIKRFLSYTILTLALSHHLFQLHAAEDLLAFVNDELFEEKLKSIDINKSVQSSPHDFTNSNILLSLDEMVERMKAQDFTLRIHAQRLYQTRMRVKASINLLLPHLNFSLVTSGFQADFYDATSSLIGFIFPAHWFKRQEHKLFYEAQKHAYHALVANQVNHFLSLVYKIHSIKCIYHIYSHHCEKIKSLLDLSQKRIDIGEDRLDQKLKIENIYLNLRSDQVSLQKLVKKLLYRLAFVLNLDIQDWDRFDIKEIALPDLQNVANLSTTPYVEQIKHLTPELKEMRYLIKAAKYNIKKRKYVFLSPLSDHETSLGLGYFSQLEIGKSKRKELKITQEKIEANLEFTLRKAISDYNSAIELYKTSKLATVNANQLIRMVHIQFYEAGEYHIQDNIDSLNSYFRHCIELIQIQHSFLSATSLLDRLMFTKDYKHLDQFKMQPHKKTFQWKASLENLLFKKKFRGF